MYLVTIFLSTGGQHTLQSHHKGQSFYVSQMLTHSSLNRPLQSQPPEYQQLRVHKFLSNIFPLSHVTGTWHTLDTTSLKWELNLLEIIVRLLRSIQYSSKVCDYEFKEKSISLGMSLLTSTHPPLLSPEMELYFCDIRLTFFSLLFDSLHL